MLDLDLETAKLILEKFDAVSVVDTKGRYIYANQNWLNNMNITAEELAGKYPWDLIPESKVSEVLKNKRPVIGHTLANPRLKEGIVSYYPIFKDNEFFGVLIWVFSTWAQVPTSFSNTINMLTREIRQAKAQLQAMTTANGSLGRLTGESPSMQRLREEIIAVAPTPATVLIEGESGAGKDVVARAIHDLSENTRGRFIKINCANLSENADIELFGCEERYVRGVKQKSKIGKLEMANGGTVFLDEIGQLPPQLYGKFMETLESGCITRVGSDKTIKISARIIASSSIPLRALVDSGQFNENLFYLLSVVRIWVPPLRQRREDIPHIIFSYIPMINQRLNKNIETIDQDVVKLLQEYNWPGNVIELRNVLESAMIQDTDGILTKEDFMVFSYNGPNWTLPRRHKTSQNISTLDDSALKNIKRDMQFIATRDALIECKGNKTDAAKMLGISRAALYKRIQKYDLSKK